MSRLCVIAALVSLSACRIALEDPVEETAPRACSASTVQACVDGAQHSDLTWIEQNVFPKCTFSGCHNGMSSDAGLLDLREGHSRMSLVNVDSKVATGSMLTGKAKLVTPGNPNQSYLLVMLRAITPEQHDPPLDAPPADIGYMPQNAGGVVTCCQKLDALTRWIEDGAQAN